MGLEHVRANAILMYDVFLPTCARKLQRNCTVLSEAQIANIQKPSKFYAFFTRTETRNGPNFEEITLFVKMIYAKISMYGHFRRYSR